MFKGTRVAGAFSLLKEKCTLEVSLVDGAGGLPLLWLLLQRSVQCPFLLVHG